MLLADRVLFIDAEAMVVDKPAGLPVDAPRDGSLSVMNHLDSLRFSYARLPLPVHRLDRDTSGCLLLARNPRAHKKFAAAFEAGTVGKSYLAVLDGVPKQAAGRIDLPLTKISSREGGWRMTVEKLGKAAVTNWETVGLVGERALVLFTPETGRTHQLRVHAATGIGIPIVGDPVYGPSTGFGGGVPMMLHAYALTMPRDNHAAITAVSPLPEVFVAAGFRYG